MLIDIQTQLKEAMGVSKRPFSPPEQDETLVEKVKAEALPKTRETLLIPGKVKRSAALHELKSNIVANLVETHPEQKREISDIFQDVLKKISRDLILNEGRRIDNRKFD